MAALPVIPEVAINFLILNKKMSTSVATKPSSSQKLSIGRRRGGLLPQLTTSEQIRFQNDTDSFLSESHTLNEHNPQDRRQSLVNVQESLWTDPVKSTR
ncbi:hypothetical protein TcasGA2_TC010511 [Tribolium castaneum]|uniref:Uncharacterized protein n=1 Tax=Tribolium castaneum TaxID=7070 RepID=D6WE06_TRICA|nr:hypothetical protein TcasGA2_TC010511 [Tribolium castaneum]